MVSILLIAALVISILFAINMGCSGTAPSFASAYGSKILSHKKIALLFTACVLLGSFLLGSKVVKTISKGLIPQESITLETVVIILLAACIAMIIANFLRVPQSTSQATVLSVVGIGVYRSNLRSDALLLMVPLWFILPIASFFLAFLLGKFLYKRLEKVFKGRDQALKIFVIITCCYVAFGIGTNNVANAVGPLVGAGIVSNIWGFFIIAPFFGLGSFLIGHRVLKTTGENITDIDLIRASLVCFVTGSLLITASFIGIPQSLVQMNTLAIIGIGLSNGGKECVDRNTIGRLLGVWLIAPLIAFFISFVTIGIITII